MLPGLQSKVNPGKDKKLKAHIRRELERGIEPVALAESTGVPKTTIRHWRRNLEQHGSMDALPSGNTVKDGKSLTREQEHVSLVSQPDACGRCNYLSSMQYLLGYMHGRPDAKLIEMQKILKEAFDINVRLPTISRTLVNEGLYEKIQ